MPEHLVEQLLAIARQLDKPPQPTFVQNPGPYLLTLEDKGKTTRYLIESPPDLLPSQWAEVRELADEICTGLSQKDLTLLLIRLTQEWGQELSPVKPCS